MKLSLSGIENEEVINDDKTIFRANEFDISSM